MTIYLNVRIALVRNGRTLHVSASGELVDGKVVLDEPRTGLVEHWFDANDKLKLQGPDDPDFVDFTDEEWVVLQDLAKLGNYEIDEDYHKHLEEIRTCPWMY